MTKQAKTVKTGDGKAPKLFVWAMLLALIAGLIEAVQPLEDAARTVRNGMHTNEVSGDIVLVKIDRETYESMGGYPWPRTVHADVIDKSRELGAKDIYFDMVFAGRTTPEDDAALVAAMDRFGKVKIAALEDRNHARGGDMVGLPEESFRKAAHVGSINAFFNFQTAVWKLAYTDEIDGKEFPTFAAMLAGVEGPAGETFPIDYSIKLDSIPSVSVVDLIEGRVPREAIEGKSLLVGITLLQLGDQVYIPGVGRRGGAYVQILGAETLKAGTPLSLGWWPALVLAGIALAIACWNFRPGMRFPVLIGTAIALPVLAYVLESNMVFLDIMPGLLAILIGVSVLTSRFFRTRGYVNDLTNLPNLAALRANKDGRSKPLIAARIHNYAEIASTLNADGERRLVEQIAARLALGRHNGWQLYQGDEGIFAWFVESDLAISQHLDALHALFRSPVRIQNQPYDIAISFGVEMGSGRSLASRLGSALVAAEEAGNEAIKWKYHDPSRLHDTPWRLSLLSQLEDAIDEGEVWIALQPKVDLKTKRTIGAEALARWSHPEKGPISPTEFVAAAEQNDRIGKLTHFVLEEAGKALSQLRKVEPDFSIAVNLSARMLTDRNLTGEILNMLDRHGLPPKSLTLELTETAALAGTGADIELLTQLRAIGIEISIDDYGTGLSTLDYLKKVPASELKIDQSFIRSMRDNRSDLIMVQSTIALAHSLDRKVVAEGVEEKQVLEQLAMMGCDQAQGFVIGRPMALSELTRWLDREKKRRAA